MTENVKTEENVATNGRRGLRRLGILMAGLGIGSLAAFLFSRSRGDATRAFPDNVVDDRGTTQEKAARILRKLRDRAFAASDEKLALALGRPVEEIAAWGAGLEVIDDDVVMKARGIAMARGVRVE